MKRSIIIFNTGVLAVALGGCTTMEPMDDLAAKNAELQASVSKLETDLMTREQALSAEQMKLSEYEQRLRMAETQTGEPNLPPNAKPGECYARVFIPPKYETATKQVLKQAADEKVQLVPAQFQWAEERVLVKEASTRLEVIPAKYNTVEERVLVKEASEELVSEPAVYANEVEKLLVRPAYTTWKKGRGPIEKIDDTTGEIMCLVEVPAEYKTITKRVLVKPATTRKVTIPAEYRTVKKRVMAEPPKTVTVEIPAEYRTVRVKKLVTPAKEQRIAIPASYETVTEQKLVSGGKLQWRSILCETNTTPDVVTSLQRALRKAGYNPGMVDGILGDRTMEAVQAYQRAKGLPRGELTMDTLRSLGVVASN